MFDDGDGMGPVLASFNEGAGAIDWVDDPPVRARPFVRAALFAEDAVIGESFSDTLADGFERVGGRASYPRARLTVPSPVARRSVSIGNAAHTIHPVAAQGFNLGLRDVAALTELLTEAAASGDDPGSETLLQTYADWREPDVSRTVAFTDGMVRAFSQSFGPVALERSVGLLALQLAPGLRGALAHRGMGFGGQRPPAMALAEATR